MTSRNLKIVICHAPAELEMCMAIRHAVFVIEQNVPVELERDAADQTAIHMLAYLDAEGVGTARVIVKQDGASAKVGRVATLQRVRGLGIGRALMQAIADEPSLRNVATFTLHAQTQASGFYHQLGYETIGAPFMEAGMPHVEMRLTRSVGSERVQHE